MVIEISEMRVAMDDWRGVTSPAERKKRQNLLSQRAYRRRMKDQQGSAQCSNSASTATSAAGPHSTHAPLPDTRQKCEMALILDTFQDYSLNAPRPSQLQLLIRLNVLDGLARNAEALGFPVKGLCADEFISPFNYQDGHRPSSQPSHPESLSPTAPQRTVRHHPWVDLFPLARLRDNILRGLDSGTIDEDELCSDLLNVEDTNWSDVKKPSLILWGEPWDIKGWEASAAFLRKWGWITQGCPELIEGTDYWRRIRGEQGIVFDVSDDGASTMATVNLVSALSESRT
ncbi:hypothetical protein BN1708_013652 [Verticillium longisporum]|uniref:BZIP domain-containing protein n=1 Tax=Verticillium longisporum TaxID=100787 RepID=A0A0G4LNQ0_VERLO|nr:hypothetical protein BN1708_013652 [Verticillium longisporum]